MRHGAKFGLQRTQYLIVSDTECFLENGKSLNVSSVSRVDEKRAGSTYEALWWFPKTVPLQSMQESRSCLAMMESYVLLHITAMILGMGLMGYDNLDSSFSPVHQ